MTDTDLGDGSGAPRPAESSGASPKELVSEAAHALKQEGASFVCDARDKAVEKIEERKETATQTLGDFANAIRKAGDELAGRDQSMATQVVRRAADGLEGIARSISDKRPEELLDWVRDFGRRNPTAFIAGSVLAGIALGRFLKSSGQGSDDASGAPSYSDQFYSTSSDDGALATSSQPLGELGSYVPVAEGASPAQATDDDHGGEFSGNADRGRFGSGS